MAADVAPLVAPVRLRDPALDQALQRDGFVVVDLLDAPALATLRALWEEVRPTELRGIWSNVHGGSVELNRHVDATITACFGPGAQRTFADGYLAGASFLVKGTGADSASTPHQDWNHVDEAVSQSLSIWAPLVDVDEGNGALQVIPGSHRLRPSIRSLDTPSLYLDFDERIEPLLRCVPVRAGQAVLYAHNLFHGSKPNTTDEVRVSAVSGVLPHGVRHVHYRRRAGSPRTFEVLEVSRPFFLEGIPAAARGEVPPTARLGEAVEVARPTLELADVLAGPLRPAPSLEPR